MLNNEGSVELYFFEKEDAQTEFETVPQNRQEEPEQNLNVPEELKNELISLAGRAATDPLEELIQISGELSEIEGKLWAEEAQLAAERDAAQAERDAEEAHTSRTCSC